MQNIQKAIEDIELEMARNQAMIDSMDELLGPLREKLDKANAEVQAAQARADQIAKDIQAQRGDAREWIAFKKRHGELASTRMALRALLKAQG